MKQRRRGFFAPLLGLSIGAMARGQSTIISGECSDHPERCIPAVIGRPTDYNRKPANNECPVCGTVAETYKRAAVVTTTDCDSVPGSQFVVKCKIIETPIGEPSQITRCKNCNAAFFQDAEEAPKR